MADSVEGEGSTCASSASAGSMVSGTAGSATSGVAEVYVSQAEAAAEAQLAHAAPSVDAAAVQVFAKLLDGRSAAVQGATSSALRS